MKDSPFMLKVLIELIDTPHILRKVWGQIKEVCRLIKPCLLNGTREYLFGLSGLNLHNAVKGHFKQIILAEVPTRPLERDYRYPMPWFKEKLLSLSKVVMFL